MTGLLLDHYWTGFKPAAAVQNQILNLRSTQISKIMAIPLELQIRQLAHAATGDKLVCPRNGELQQGSSGPVWDRQVPASEDSSPASLVSSVALIVSLAFGLLPADLVGCVAAYTSQTKHQMGVWTIVRAVRHSDHLIALSSLPRSTLAPDQKAQIEKILGFVLQLRV